MKLNYANTLDQIFFQYLQKIYHIKANLELNDFVVSLASNKKYGFPIIKLYFVNEFFYEFFIV